MNVRSNHELIRQPLDCTCESGRPVHKAFYRLARSSVTAPSEGHPEAARENGPAAPGPGAPRARRRIWLTLQALLAALLLLVIFAPALFGKALLARLGGPYAVSAGSIGGPLWSPTLTGVKVTGPGVQVQVGTVNVGLSGLNLAARSARLDLTLADATVALKLKTLLGGVKAGGSSAFSVLPGKIDIRNTKLNIDGTGFDVPSGRWTADSARVNGQDTVQVRGATTDGPLNLLLAYKTVGGQLQGTADIQADARIVNHYWHEKTIGGVTDGQITGRYSFGSGPVTGDIRLSNATLAVPGASFVTVGKLNGTVKQRGDLITLLLGGRGWNGPVTAQGSVDLKAHRWDVTAQASPLLSALGKSLGQGGKGVATVAAHAYGWNTVTVKADITSPQGEFSVLPFRNLAAHYFFFRDKKLRNNDLTFSADTRFQGQQKLSGIWTFNKAGTLAWTGTLLSRPLDLKGKISAGNVITAQGQALGGPLSGSLGLRDKAVTLAASPDFYSVSGDLTAQGTLDRLNIALRGGKAGPVAFAGTALFGRSGLNADLGPVQLRLDRQLRGTWRADGLSTSGVQISGSGELRVPEASLTGQLSAAVPLLTPQPSGPISLNWQKRVADWTFAGGNLTWRGETFALHSDSLKALGYDLRGDLALTTALKASGTIRATSPNGSVVATGLGDRLGLVAVQNGVTVTAQTLLKPGFQTTAQVQGAQISGTVSVDQSVQFSLNTAGSRAQGSLELGSTQNWNATGTLDLAALRPLLGGNLNGVARLNLAGQGGTVGVNGSGYGAQVNGVLTRSGTRLTARTDVAYPLGSQGRVSAQLAGRVFPDLDLAGPVALLGSAYGEQQLQARLSGSYSSVQAAVYGRLTAITAAGITLPAQLLALTGQLSPALNLSGSYGNLKLGYSGGTVNVSGSQTLSGYGQAGQLSLTGSYGPDWVGQLAASGNLGPYTLRLNGPWRDLNTALTGAGLRASGSLNAVTRSYALRVRGPLAGLYLQGNVVGTGANPKGDLTVSDGSGGSARVTLNGLTDFRVQAASLTLAGQKVQGQLNAVDGLLNGTLSAGPLNIVARNGLFTASGSLANHTLGATGRLSLPATLNDLKVKVSGPILNAVASGSGHDLRGQVTLAAQHYSNLLRLPGQTLALSADPLALSANLGGLRYRAGGWAGQTRLKYSFGAQAGQFALIGAGATLSAVPSGPLAGRVQVLPSLGGTLSAPVSPLLTLLPAQVAGAIQPGRLSAAVQPTGAALTLLGTQYLGQPLGLNANVSWNSGLKISAVLTHPDSRVPLSYDGQGLTVRGATVDAGALKPFLGTLDLSGSVQADLNLPGLKLDAGSGRLKVDLKAAGQRAQGNVTLAAGVLSADLSSDLDGQTLRLQGPLYPTADAALQFGTLRATLIGDLRRQALLDVSGSYSGRQVALKAAGGLSPASVKVAGTVAGLNLDLQTSRTSASDWTVGGTFGAADLTALLGTPGALSGTVGGTLNDVQLSASGRAYGADFTLPARYTGGVLSVRQATAALRGAASASVSGTVFPALALHGPLTLSDYLAGTYAVSATGALSKPDLRLSGTTTGGPSGLDVPGSTLSARLLGKDWRLNAAGEKFSGVARGQFGNTLGPAGIVLARFNVNAPYRTGGQTVTLDGVTGWSQAAGFLGELQAGGSVSGQTLAATLRGNGDLSLDAVLGSNTVQGKVTGRFPASLPLRPGGSLTLQTFDLGALWGRPEQLRLSADAALTGQSWSLLGASLKGALNDSAGELTGAVQASLNRGDLALNLAGRKLSGSASLSGGEYRAQLSSSGVRLARLVPASAGVTALTLSAQASASGSTSAGLREIRASGLNLRGVQTQTGPFSLSGSVLYLPGQISADLNGTVYGGTLSASGSLPGGLNVQMNGLKPAGLGLDTLDGTVQLSGAATDPRLAGRLTVSRPELTASLDLSGTTRQPRLNAAANLRGGYAGRLLAEVGEVQFSPLSAQLHLYGSAAQGSNRVKLDLTGLWPKLSGTASAQVSGLKEPVSLTGDGSGSYALNAGTLGTGTLRLDGFVPSLLASLHLTPLPLVGGTGEASADLNLSGPLSALQLTARSRISSAEVGSVRVQDLNLSVAGPLTGQGAGLNALTGTLSQSGRATGKLERGSLTFGDLRASGYGFQASATGRATLSGTGSAALTLTGPGVGADLKAAYAGGSVALSGSARASGFIATLNSTGSLKNGWNGTLGLTGGPAGVLTEPGRFTLGGPLLQPLLSGSLGLEGAGVRLVADRQNVQLRLVDGPGVQASGVLSLDLARSLWAGRIAYTRPEASLAVRLSGPAGSPLASLDLTRGSWRATGTATTSSADLNVTDGAAAPVQGRVRWDGQTVGVNLPGLSLEGLNITGLSGNLRATGSIDTKTLDGAVQLALGHFETGYTLPTVNLPLNGDLNGTVTLKAGRLQAKASLTSAVGTVDLQLAQPDKSGPYTGALKAKLVQPAGVTAGTVTTGTVTAATVTPGTITAATAPVTVPAAAGSSTASGNIGAPQTVRAGGTLNADLTLGVGGLKGTLSANGVNLNLGGLNARLNGTAALDGRSFTVQASASSDRTGSDAQVSLSGSGGLADLAPQLTALAGIEPTGDGYSLRASLNALELQGLKVAPNLSGKVSGEAVLSDGGGTFVLRSNALRLGDTELAARFDGTLVGDGSLVRKNSLLASDWRIRGVVGNTSAATSLLSASLSGGILSGTFQLRGLPLDAFLSAFSGTLPGRGVLTGIARFRLPLADPLAGEVNVVAERLTVSSTMTVPATVSDTAAQGAATPASSADTPSQVVTQPITQTLAGSGFVRYANRELQNIDLHLTGAGRWDVTGQYTRRLVGVTASFQNTTFTPALLFIPSLRDLTPSLQGTLSLSVAGTYARPVGNLSGSNLQGALGGISLRVPTLSGQLPDSGLFTAQAAVQAGGTLGADGAVKIGGRLDTFKLSGLTVGYSGLLILQGLGRIENVQATVAQVGAGTSDEGYTIQAQAAGGVGVGSLSLQGRLSPLYDLRLSARNFNLPISLIYGRQSRINADLSAAEQIRTGGGGPIDVTGAVNVLSLVLGTGGTAAVIPAPGASSTAAGENAATSTYVSPFPEELSTFPKAAEATLKAVSPLLSRVVFRNVPVRAPSGIRVDESIARAELGGDLVLAGTGSAPTLNGQIRAIRGSVDLRDNSFNIDSGSAVFGGTSLYPVLAVSATGDVPLSGGGTVGVNLTLDGRFGPTASGSNALTLDTHLRCVRGCVAAGVDLSPSNPSAEAQLYSLVAVGTPDLTSLPNNLGTLGTSALKTALNLFVLGELQRNIARALGVDVFRINAALPGENGSTTFGATFTVGSYLTKQLYLQYRVDLTGLGLIDATYTTPDNLFTFKASTPIQGLDLSTLRPSFSAAYNLTNRSSVQLGVQSGASTKVSFGYVYRW